MMNTKEFQIFIVATALNLTEIVKNTIQRLALII